MKTKLRPLCWINLEGTFGGTLTITERQIETVGFDGTAFAVKIGKKRLDGTVSLRRVGLVSASTHARTVSVDCWDYADRRDEALRQVRLAAKAVLDRLIEDIGSTILP